MIEIKNYVKRPLVIEAMRYMGEWPQIRADFEAWGLKTWHFGQYDMEYRLHCLVIRTLEGEMEVDIGDWIIKGIKGEFYPCKHDIFIETYSDYQEPSISRSIR